MAKNFLDQEDKPEMSYADGFRFGFGFFIANLLGATVLGLLATGIAMLTGQLH
jgi:hypothetical protein